MSWRTCLLFGALLVAGACSANDGSDDELAPGAVGGSGGNGGASGSGASGGTMLSFGGSAGTNVSPRETVVIVGPGADGTTPDKFAGDPTGAAPQLVYPDSGIVVPPNMNSLELHFVPAPGQTQFELHFAGASVDLFVYIGCTPLGAGCLYEPDATFWNALIDDARGAPEVTYTLRGVDGSGVIGESEERSLSVTLEDIVGGLYYWNDAGIINRFDFGYPLQTAEVYMNAPQAGAGVCVGCHVVSPDGSRIVVGKDIPAPAPYTVFDVATRQAVTTSGGQHVAGAANFFSFSPNGAQLLYSGGVKIGWRDVSTGNIVNDTVVPSGTMPDWSPDGSKMVYARSSTPPPLAVPGISSGNIEIMPFSNGSFGGATLLVQSQNTNNYYPTISPDNSWVLFNHSPSNQESMSNTLDGELAVVSTEGGGAVRLDAVSNPGWTSWPKWAPGLHTTSNSRVMYFTYSSARAYGLRLADNEKVQLWMSAFDPAKVAAGQDPAAPAFRLPFQDLSSGNHIAQWVAEIVRRPCDDVGVCDPGEICEDGVCVPPIVK